MVAYLIKRLLLIIPTLFGIMLVSFAIIQFAPGGPIERILAQLEGRGNSATSNIGGGQVDAGMGGRGTGASGQVSDATSTYRGAQGLDPEFIKKLEKQFGFDKPPFERFVLMMGNYLTFNFGESYFKNQRVIDLIRDKLPVSMSLGLWLTLISYLISIPLGIRKAVRDGTKFDVWTSSVLILLYGIPGFLLAVFLLVMFAGGTFLQIFPARGLSSDTWNSLSMLGKIGDYLWHLVLPLTALCIGSFATLTFLTKNSFIDEIRKQYVVTARAKGLTEWQVLYGHVFRNAMLLVISGFPAAFIGAFFTGSLLIEKTFSLDGMGLLGYESIINRDYPVVFATLFIFSLMGLAVRILTDFTYTLVDPRIDFESRSV